jgi:hypothetical protein
MFRETFAFLEMSLVRRVGDGAASPKAYLEI